MKATDIFLETIDGTDFHVRSFSDHPLNYPMHYHPHLELLYCSRGALQLHLDKYTLRPVYAELISDGKVSVFISMKDWV